MLSKVAVLEWSYGAVSPSCPAALHAPCSGGGADSRESRAPVVMHGAGAAAGDSLLQGGVERDVTSFFVVDENRFLNSGKRR